MFDIKDLVSLPLRNGYEGVLRGHILTQVGLDSRQYIDGTRRSLDESIDTIGAQRSNEMKPVARFRSREIVAPSLLLLSNPMSFRNLNPRHTLLNSSQVSFYNRLRSGVLRKLGETIAPIALTSVKPRETATQKHSQPHSGRNKKNVSPSTIIHPTNPITHRSLQSNVDLILPPIRIAVYFVGGLGRTRITHSTFLPPYPLFHHLYRDHSDSLQNRHTSPCRSGAASHQPSTCMYESQYRWYQNYAPSPALQNDHFHRL